MVPTGQHAGAGGAGRRSDRGSFEQVAEFGRMLMSGDVLVWR